MENIMRKFVSRRDVGLCFPMQGCWSSIKQNAMIHLLLFEKIGGIKFLLVILYHVHDYSRHPKHVDYILSKHTHTQKSTFSL